MYTQPFRLATFTVTLQQSKAQLNWTTSAEKNTMNFTIERSRDTLTWLAIGTVNAAGNSTTTRSYSFRDTATQTGTVYYRLNMLTHDNRRFFSKVVKFTFPAARIKSSPQAPVVSDAKDGILLAPNPTQESTQLLGLSPGNHAVRIFDFSGREIYFNPQFQPGKKIDAHHWTRGVYIVIVDEGKYRLKIVKQ